MSTVWALLTIAVILAVLGWIITSGVQLLMKLIASLWLMVFARERKGDGKSGLEKSSKRCDEPEGEKDT
jgi:hypothetical protein